MKIEPIGAIHESSYRPVEGSVQTEIDDSNKEVKHSIVESSVNNYHDSAFEGDSVITQITRIKIRMFQQAIN